jgi:hypothetical protein
LKNKIIDQAISSEDLTKQLHLHIHAEAVSKIYGRCLLFQAEGACNKMFLHIPLFFLLVVRVLGF